MTPDRWRQIEELYHSAQERAPADRAALLAQADPELRREVEAMLAQDASDGKILDRPAEDLLTNSRSTMVGPGSQLGPYQIEALLGAGGMGRVYRAVDTRLGRNVAIKISAKEFTDRFQREARAISALNHPNICTLHDVGPNYLVMEQVEGETLAARLKKGKLSIEDTLLYGGQIAAALAEAHSKGITHRDLKPGNIMVGKNGVKVLDFGLAKVARAFRGADPSQAAGESLTVSQAIMGTPGYMAPEQRDGKECDARTDIYALGLVLREMAKDLPPHAAHVVEQCLANDPGERWQAASDVRRELEWAATSPATRSPAPPTRSPTPLGWIAAAVLVFALGMAIWGWLRTPPTEPHPVTRWMATLPASDPILGSGLAISRDGARLAYADLTGDSSRSYVPNASFRIWVRMLDQPEGRPIPGTEGGVRPLLSPDGQWLAYFTGPVGLLKKIHVTGGTPITLCDGAGYFGGSWGEDDRIIFSGSRGLMRVPASGGTCENLTRADAQRREVHRWAHLLPGGESILFTIGVPGSFDSARIAVLDLKSGEIRVLVNGASAARYVPSGHLVYVRGGTMFAVPFDLKRLVVTGPETPVIEGVFYNSTGGFADYAFSDSGLLVYRAEARPVTEGPLEWLDRKGGEQALAAPPQQYTALRLSPDGRRALVGIAESAGGRRDIWIYELARGASTRLTSVGFNENPVWTPDGRRVAFTTLHDGKMYWIPADGSGRPEPLLPSQATVSPDSWTPDGKTLLYGSGVPAHIWMLPVPGSGGESKPLPLLQATAFNESQAQVSPDGRWVAYTSDESGKSQVYARPFPGPGGKTSISIEGGQDPRWSRDGRELFYRDAGKNRLMAVDIMTNPAFRAGQPHTLFALGNVPWDVAPDGKRFLVVKEPEAAASEAKMQAVVNWFEELRQKAPRK